MGLTEGHWFENEEDLTERQLEKAISDEKAAYERGFRDGSSKNVDAIPVGWLKGLMLSTEDDVDKAEFAWIMREWESEQKEGT